MDFQGFMDFLLAWSEKKARSIVNESLEPVRTRIRTLRCLFDSNAQHPVSVTYLFRCFDIENRSYITAREVRVHPRAPKTLPGCHSVLPATSTLPTQDICSLRPALVSLVNPYPCVQVRLFFTEVSEKWVALGQYPVRVDDVVDEVFDMARGLRLQFPSVPSPGRLRFLFQPLIPVAPRICALWCALNAVRRDATRRAAHR